MDPIISGKSKTINVRFSPMSSHKKHKKYIQINYNRNLIESDYTNNKISFKNKDYIRYKSDLKVIKKIILTKSL